MHHGSLLPLTLSQLSFLNFSTQELCCSFGPDTQQCLRRLPCGSVESFLIRHLLERKNEGNRFSIVAGFSVVTCSFLLAGPPSSLPTPPRRRKMTAPPQPPTVMVWPRTTTSGRRHGPSCPCVSLGIPDSGQPALPCGPQGPFPRGQGWGVSAEMPRHCGRQGVPGQTPW